jgi:ABC-type lipoprotein export system ATPase subunit
LDTIYYNNVLPIPLKDSPLDGIVWKKEISFERGNKYLIMADSGKGKSTFLNIIYGIRKDYTGSVLFDREDIKNASQNHMSFLRANQISYLFQDLRLFGNISARENILLKPGCKFTNGEIEFYAEKIGVLPLLDRNCATLSLGQQQRIAMLRALSQPFKWLLLDEPFSHLDVSNAEKMMEFVHTRVKEESAGILATSLGDKRSFDEFNIINL